MKKKKRIEKRKIIVLVIGGLVLMGGLVYVRGWFKKIRIGSVVNEPSIGEEFSWDESLLTKPPTGGSLLGEARKISPNCDYIIDLDTMKPVWVDEETMVAFGYSPDEVDQMLSEKIYESLDKRYGKERYLSEVLGRMAGHKGEFEIVNTKDEQSFLITISYHVLEYEDVGYMVGEILGKKKISEEEAAEYYSE